MSDSAAMRQRRERLAGLAWQDAGAPTGTFSGSLRSFADIWSRRELLGMLTRRELKARYKDSALGFLWSLARPLTQLLIYYVVVGQFLGAARSIENFAVYVFAGLTIYTLFSEIVATGTSSILANTGLVKKVYLPREIFPLASIGSALFNFAIQVAILLAAALVIGTMRFDLSLLYALGSTVLILIYGAAFALILSAANVYLRDIQYLVEVVLLLLMWASPIVYSIAQVTAVLPGWAMHIFINNPITLAVLGFHVTFWSEADIGISSAALAEHMGIAALIGLVFVFIAQRVFARLEGNFAQEL
ncbi:ABC transporter permease [Agromyces aerolatus]|uniref:ABC transporter permease n=1 Tax=Agromyces sp. LY-1074 TaxID=3074080 RepID=UPI00285D2BEA|nr:MULTISPECIES: ABC transporter permease [unclassified Agromyces]MDR5700376.1 ABC transporter permease [Agromyces sp. LY-1074]MDR5706646.1 ABC transporter permease [Agromyces sp. LY-1358]